MPTEPQASSRRVRRIVGITLGLLAFAAIAFLPSPLHRIEGQGDRPAYMAAVAALMAIWWFTEALPIAWTACLPLLLFPLLDVHGKGVAGDAKAAVEPFFDAYIFLFMGGMALGAAMEQWNLHRRIALHIMRAIGSDPRRLLLGMVVATAAVSLWISNTATAVMMLPIAMALIAELSLSEGGRRLTGFGAALTLGVAYGANVGGLGTKIGSPTNSMFAGFLSEKIGYELGFLQYMLVGLPFVVLFLPIVWFVLWQLARRDRLPSAQGRDVLDRALAEMGSMSRGEKIVAAVFASAAALWIFGDPVRELISPHVPEFWDGYKFRSKHYEAWVAMGAALVLLLVRGVSFASLRRVPWSTLVLMGGSFALASGIDGSGLSLWLASRMGALTELPMLQQLLGVSAATILLSAIASNTATVGVMLSVLPRAMPLFLAANLASSCDFALPAGTPPNAIVFGSGYVRLPTMMKVGVVLDVLAAVLIALYVYLYAGRML